MKPLFITGIGTDVGKTIVSAILVEKLKADYWKPIQSGELHNSDTQKVRNLISNQISFFHKESYKLTHPFSPHKSAHLDGITIDLQHILPPKISNQLVIEGAGGLLVPLNTKDYVIDLIQMLNTEVILVIKNYLGSINHTLLSLALLNSRNIPIKGIILNGETDLYSEQAIYDFCQPVILGRIPIIKELNQEKIIALGKELSL